MVWFKSLSLSGNQLFTWERGGRGNPLLFMGFPDASDGEESACHVGDLGSVPGGTWLSDFHKEFELDILPSLNLHFDYLISSFKKETIPIFSPGLYTQCQKQCCTQRCFINICQVNDYLVLLFWDMILGIIVNRKSMALSSWNFHSNKEDTHWVKNYK